MKIVIIGTSPITEQHIKSIKKLNGEIALISSTRKNSKLLPYLAKKYKIKNKFYNWKHAINFASKLKNMAFLISGRLSHNRRILNKCVKLNRKIFIEKPVFLKSKTFNSFLNSHKNIFVGYNRIKFNNINYLKKELKKEKQLTCIVKLPEVSKKNIFTNSCHVVSIIKFLFGKFHIYKIINNQTNQQVILQNKNKLNIFIFINYRNSDNFTIEIFSKKRRFLLSPIEKLKIFKSIKKKRMGSNNIFIPKKSFEIVEKMGNSKPGFDKQMKDFIYFCKKGYLPKENSLKFAKEVIHLIEKFLKS